MLSHAEIDIIVKAIDQVSATLNGIVNNAKAQFRQLQAAGTSMTMGFTLPIAAIGGASLKMASDFSAAMEQIHTQAGASQAEVDSMSKSVLDLAKTVPVGPEALATGLYHVESLGLRGAQALDVLKAAAEESAMSGADLEATASTLGAVIQSGIPGVKDYATAMGILNGVIGAGNLRFADLNEALSSGIMATAKSVGLTLTDLGGALATMADSGVPAVDTATRLQTALLHLDSPTDAMTKAFAAANLGQLQLARDLRDKGLLFMLQDLKTHIDAVSKDPVVQTDLLAQMFTVKSASVMLGLINQIPLLGQKLDTIQEQGKTFGQDFADYLGIPQAKWKQFIADVQVDAVKLGNAIIPVAVQFLTAMTPVLDVIDQLITRFQALPTPVQNGILMFFAFLAVLGPVVFAVGAVGGAVVSLVAFFTPLIALLAGLVPAFGGAAAAALGLGAAETAALGPVGLLIAALAGLGAAAYLLATNWSTIWGGITSVAQQGASDVVQLWYGMIQNMLPPIPSWATYVQQTEQWLVQQSESAWSQIETSWNDTWARMPGAVDGPLGEVASKLGGFLGDVGGALGSFFGGIGGKIQDIYAGATNSGNVGPGPGPHHELGADGNVHYYNSKGEEIFPFPTHGRIPEAPSLPDQPHLTLPDLGSGLDAALGGLSGAGAAIPKAVSDLQALAAAFAAWHAQTGGTIFDFEVMLKLTGDQAALDQKRAQAEIDLDAATMENQNAQYQLEQTYVSLAETAIQKGETIQQATRDLFQGIADNVQSVFNQIAGGPTVEGTQLQLQIDKLQLQEDLLKRGGAVDSVAKGQTMTAADRQLKAIEDQINALKEEQTIRADSLAVQKDQFALDNHLLQTDAEQLGAMKFLDAAMGHLSGTVQDLDRKMGLITGASGGTASPHAFGGIASGLSLVGEQGPEVADFAHPARIYTNAQLREALGAGGGGEGGGGTTVTIEQHFTVDSSMSDAAKRDLARQMRDEIQGALVQARVGGSMPPGGSFA